MALLITAAMVINLAAACGSTGAQTTAAETESQAEDETQTPAKAYMTAEDIAAAVSENLAGVNSYELSSTIEYDYTLTVACKSTKVKTKTASKEETVLDPAGSHIQQKSATSYNGTKSSQSAEVYIVQESGKTAVYVNSDDTWSKSGLTQAESTRFYIDIFADVAQGNLNASMASDTAYVNDKDCYQMKVMLNEAYIKLIVANIYNSADIAEGIDAEGLNIYLIVYIDCADMMPVKMKMDFTEIGSMLMEQMTGGTGDIIEETQTSKADESDDSDDTSDADEDGNPDETSLSDSSDEEAESRGETSASEDNLNEDSEAGSSAGETTAEGSSETASEKEATTAETTEDLTIEYVTEKFEIEYEYTGFDTIAEIVIPDDVKSQVK